MGADSSTRAFSSNDINALFERAPIEIYRHPIYEFNPRNTNHILVAYAAYTIYYLYYPPLVFR